MKNAETHTSFFMTKLYTVYWEQDSLLVRDFRPIGCPDEGGRDVERKGSKEGLDPYLTHKKLIPSGL